MELNYIHRHTGGLESYLVITKPDNPIHRHTGGLEKS